MISTDPFSPVNCEVWPPWITQMLHAKVTSTLMAGPKVSYQDIAQSATHCLLQFTFYPIVHTGARCFPGKRWTKPRHPHDVKEHVIDQTRPLSSIASWSTSDAHMAIVGAFSGEQGSAWAPWLSAPYTTYCNALSIRTSMKPYGSLTYSSLSVASDHTGWRSLKSFNFFLLLTSTLRTKKRWSVLFTSAVSGQTVIPDQCESVIKGMIPVHQKPLLEHLFINEEVNPDPSVYHPLFQDR